MYLTDREILSICGPYATQHKEDLIKAVRDVEKAIEAKVKETKAPPAEQALKAFNEQQNHYDCSANMMHSAAFRFDNQRDLPWPSDAKSVGKKK